MIKINYQTMQYEPSELIAMAENGSKWAARELRLNGFVDYSEADAGNEPKLL